MDVGTFYRDDRITFGPRAFPESQKTALEVFLLQFGLTFEAHPVLTRDTYRSTGTELIAAGYPDDMWLTYGGIKVCHCYNGHVLEVNSALALRLFNDVKNL